MKRSAFFLLLFAVLYGCTGGSSKPLLKKSPYDRTFRYYADRLDGKKQKTKHIKKMETAYQQAQKADLLAADSLLNLEKPDRWLYVNAYYRRVGDRQQKVLSLMPLQSPDGYKPDLLIIPNISERETASRKASAQFLYEKAQNQLAVGHPAAARGAYRTLVNLRDNYYPVWENASQLLDQASVQGVEHVLLESDRLVPAFLQDSKWQRFYRNRFDRDSFDVVIRTDGIQVFVGPDEATTTTFTESKEIQVGVEEKKDTSGNVVERTPIYETIYATVTETIVTKIADASVYVDVLDGYTGALLRSETMSAQYLFSESAYQVSGDCRALSSTINTSAFNIFTPPYWEMENRVLAKLEDDFGWFVKSRLWTD